MMLFTWHLESTARFKNSKYKPKMKCVKEYLFIKKTPLIGCSYWGRRSPAVAVSHLQRRCRLGGVHRHWGSCFRHHSMAFLSCGAWKSCLLGDTEHVSDHTFVSYLWKSHQHSVLSATDLEVWKSVTLALVLGMHYSSDTSFPYWSHTRPGGGNHRLEERTRYVPAKAIW